MYTGVFGGAGCGVGVGGAPIVEFLDLMHICVGWAPTLQFMHGLVIRAVCPYAHL